MPIQKRRTMGFAIHSQGLAIGGTNPVDLVHVERNRAGGRGLHFLSCLAYVVYVQPSYHNIWNYVKKNISRWRSVSFPDGSAATASPRRSAWTC